MSNVEAIKKVLEGVDLRNVDQNTNERVWIGCANEDGEHASWFDAGEGGTPYIRADLVSTALEDLQRENGELLDENTDLKNPQWPAWAKAVLKVIRSHTGYDGYGDATEGVDMPQELEEHLSEMDAENGRLRHRAHTAEAEVKRLRHKVDARALDDDQLAAEIKSIEESCKGGFGEGGGSPGEWWYERADELEHERKRRELESELHQHNSRAALTAQVRDVAVSVGIEAIAAERHRQLNDEGFAFAGDDKYEKHELVEAAACYALHWTGELACSSVPMAWPWGDEWWKPTTPTRDLAKAGALIAAEIDRLTRAEKASAKQEAGQ